MCQIAHISYQCEQTHNNYLCKENDSLCNNTNILMDSVGIDLFLILPVVYK